jgi:hypothetical protein
MNSLFMNFAMQLEVEGLWYWAIYIILQLPDSQSTLKTLAIKDLISRHCVELSDKDEEFLKSKLSIPVEWIEEAKVIQSPISSNFARRGFVCTSVTFMLKLHTL